MPRDDFSPTETACRLARKGVAIVPLRAGSKRPVHDRWTNLPRASESDLRRRLHADMNIGIRLGAPSEVARRRFVHGIDMDIRVPAAEDAAWDALLEIFPEAEDWPRVLSGSGGSSRHLYFVTDAPFRSIKLAQSEEKISVDTSDGVVKKSRWEVELFGTGKQMVLPPSIHPDTGQAYRWAGAGEPEDWADLPFVRQTRIAPLFERTATGRRRADYPVEPIDNLLEILDSRALDNEGGGLDYDGWLEVIFAVKQEYDGTDDLDAAFQALEEWSQQSDKHDQRRFEEVWDHARTDRHGGISLGTLKKKVAPEIDARRKQAIVDTMEDERSADEKAGIEPPEAWLRKCRRDGGGEFLNNAENRLLFLKHQAPLEHLVWAEEEQRPVWRRPATDVAALHDLTFGERQSLPYDTRSHYQVLQKCFAKSPFYLETVRKEELNDSVFLASQKRQWHRIREVLTREKWDGVRRVETLLQDYLGVRDDAYARDVSKLLVLGPMCRVLWRGVKVDYAPILQGAQGTGKDRFLETLCTFDDESFYTASTFDLAKPAEYVQAIRGKLIVHLAEMATFRRTSIEQIKTFLTEHEDTARLSYEPLAQTYRRLCICVFSVNESGGYLRDSTGNRRFLPVELGDPKPGPDGRPTAYARDFRELEQVRGQIWAEAYEMALAEGDRQDGRVRELLLSPEALVTARRLQAEKMVEGPEADLVARAAYELELPAPLDDLVDRRARTDDSARKMALRNQVDIREFWVEVLGERRETFSRNTQFATRALDLLPGWHRIALAQPHRGAVRIVYRRTGTDGSPEIIDDVAPTRESKVIRMADEREKRGRT